MKTKAKRLAYLIADYKLLLENFFGFSNGLLFSLMMSQSLVAFKFPR